MGSRICAILAYGEGTGWNFLAKSVSSALIMKLLSLSDNPRRAMWGVYSWLLQYAIV